MGAKAVGNPNMPKMQITLLGRSPEVGKEGEEVTASGQG